MGVGPARPPAPSLSQCRVGMALGSCWEEYLVTGYSALREAQSHDLFRYLQLLHSHCQSTCSRLLWKHFTLSSMALSHQFLGK